jgi:AcrR family transcriptional regulator/DNA-binding MarR family transcriptional regulator
MITKRPNSARLSRAPRRGGVQVSEVQRARMLNSAVAVISELGYEQMSVARVTSRARVSRRTFYDVFTDREDCFLAIFEDAVERASELVRDAYERETGDWQARVRAGLVALLGFLDEEPAVASLLVIDALRAGPRALQRRAEILRCAGVVLDVGGSRSKSAGELSELTGEGVVGAVFSVIHTRLLAKRPGSLLELSSPLMGMIVLPYRGAAAARRELVRRAPASVRVPGARERSRGRSSMSSSSSVLAGDPLAGLPMRLTYRTLRVLTVVGDSPGVSNREVGEAAEVGDQGQMSKLLARLERLGLICNSGRGQSHGEPNAWRLTTLGEQVRSAIPTATASTHSARAQARMSRASLARPCGPGGA